MSFLFVYTTHPNKKTALKISKHLLKKKLIACSNIFAIESVYSWENKEQHEKEFVAILKTRKELFKKLKKEFIEMHPYKVSCIIKLNSEPEKKYFSWVKQETS